MSTELAGSSTDPGLGTVIMATDYNLYNSAFADKIQMENMEGAQSVKPSRNMSHRVDCTKKSLQQPQYFVRGQGIAAQGDQRLWDIGRFQVATQGMQSNGKTLSELWVSYEFEFKKPRVMPGQDTQASPLSVDHFTLSNNAGTQPDQPFGTATLLQTPNSGSTLGGRISGGITTLANQSPDFQIPVLDANGNPTGANKDSDANTYYFPQGVSSGQYYVSYTANWASTVDVVSTVSFAFTGCDVVTPTTTFPTEINTTTGTTPGSDGTVFTFVNCWVSIIRPNAFFTMTIDSAIPGNNNQEIIHLLVCQLPSDMV